MVYTIGAERLYMGESVISLRIIGDTTAFHNSVAIAVLLESKTSGCFGKK
jgi:hypothetical protein